MATTEQRLTLLEQQLSSLQALLQPQQPVRFWQGMARSEALNLLDKIMVGINSDGSTKYTEVNSLTSFISSTVGSGIQTPPAPNSRLPAPQQANVITVLPAGTYTQPNGGSLVVDEKTLTIGFWNGQVWSKPIVIPAEIDTSGLVAKTDIDNAFSGGDGKAAGANALIELVGNLIPYQHTQLIDNTRYNSNADASTLADNTAQIKLFSYSKGDLLVFFYRAGTTARRIKIFNSNGAAIAHYYPTAGLYDNVQLEDMIGGNVPDGAAAIGIDYVKTTGLRAYRRPFVGNKDIVDNLESGADNRTLSAKMGKLINENKLDRDWLRFPSELLYIPGRLNEDGTVTTDYRSLVTDFISREDLQVIRFAKYDTLSGESSRFALIAYYDKDKKFLNAPLIAHPSGLIYIPNNQTDFYVPKTVAFVRLHTIQNKSLNPFFFAPSVAYLYNKSADKNDAYGTEVIEIIGDSIAAQLGTTIDSDNLSGTGVTVSMSAKGGEDVLTTLMRAGAAPFMLEPFTLPSTTAWVNVQIDSTWQQKYNLDVNGNVVSYGIGQNPQVNEPADVLIGGIECQIFTNSIANANTPQVRRKTAGAQVLFSRPTLATRLNPPRNRTSLIMMGTNGGWQDGWVQGTAPKPTTNGADNLIRMFRQIVDVVSPRGNFIVNAHYLRHNTLNLQEWNDWYDYFVKGMQREFGRRFFDIREYFLTYAAADAGVTLTSADRTRINNGEVPLSLLADGTHPTGVATRVWANRLMERMVELGYLSTFTPNSI